MSLQDVIDLYNKSKQMYSSAWASQKAQAEAEEEIWLLAQKQNVHGTMLRREWLKEKLNVRPSDGEHRHTLLNSRDASDLLWEHIDSKKISLGAAHDVLAIAKRRVGTTDKAVLKKEVAKVLKIVEDGRLAEGSCIRHKAKEELMRGTQVDVDLDAPWRSIRTVLIEAVGLKEVKNELRRAKIEEEFEREIRAAYDLARNRIGREKNLDTLPIVSKTARKEVIQDACRVLGVDYPRSGEKPDMVAAKKAWRSLVRAYHPDTSGTNDTRDKYERVMKAYSVLEEI